jgi:hypothetical protein
MKDTRRKVVRLENLYREKGCCAYCGRETVIQTGPLPPLESLQSAVLWATVEHKIPQSRGGTDDPKNLVNACHVCNNMKGDMMPDEWERFCQRNPEWWKYPKRQKTMVELMRDRAANMARMALGPPCELSARPSGCTCNSTDDVQPITYDQFGIIYSKNACRSCRERMYPAKPAAAWETTT